MDKYINNKEDWLPNLEKLSNEQLLENFHPCKTCIRNEINPLSCFNHHSCRYIRIYNELLRRLNNAKKN